LEVLDFDLHQVIKQVMELFMERAQKKGLKLAYHLPLDVPTALRGDPHRLRQILINLIGNAIKFTEQGEVVLCFASRAEQKGEVWLRGAVRDTGIGIAPQVQRHIFTAFAQADNSMTRKYGGTGLGLAITKQLVELMGGELGVESVPGQGSTFWFTLLLQKSEFPVSTSPVASSTLQRFSSPLFSSPSANPGQFHGHILLAEDNPVNQVVSLAMLESLGCKVDVVANGREALAAFSCTHYDLIFMDCQMPELDGYEATKAIREHEAAHPSPVSPQPITPNAQSSPLRSRIPIVALTAHAMEGDRAHCLAAGMDDYLSKPFTQEQVRTVLERWIPHTSCSTKYRTPQLHRQIHPSPEPFG
jgi:CheY-like chemotaxis protein